MADNGWRDEDRRHWDQERNRFDSDPRGRERAGWRDDRYMERRSEASGMRRGEGDWAGRGNYADYRGNYGSPASDYQDYGDWNGQGGSLGSYGGPRFGDNWGNERDAYGRGYRNYGAGNYSSSAFGGENYGLRTAGYPLTGPDWGNEPRGQRGFWDRAGDEVASWAGDRDAAWTSLNQHDPGITVLEVLAYSLEDLTSTRRWFTSFGSCSILEPHDDLVDLGLITPTRTEGSAS